ncbi:MAG TPA: LuxR C-terminal-related transcriptional regulator, partial [Chloroflexaceae bacterium]|nr:LuxR C-terminal-related transcriptional regulator [Chloroflexaceae bacterium]
QRAADLIESAALELTMLGQSSTVNDWLRALPGELAAARPRLCLALIWGAFGRAEFAAAAPSIGLMERALAGYAGADAELLRAELAAARSILYGYLDDPRAAELGRQALAVLPPSYPAYGVVTVFYGIAHYRGGRLVAASEALERALQRPEPALHMLVNRIGLLVVLASTRRMQGRLDAALALAREAERLATRGDRLFPSTATARSLLEAGGILRERNRLDEAERCLSRCVELCDQFAGRGYRIIAHFYLAQVRQSRGDLDGAQALLDQALAELQAPHIWPAHPRELEGYRVLLALARGDIATAAAWAAGYRPPDNAGQGPMTPFDYDRFALARLQMAQGRWDAAHASLARLEADAEAGAFGYFLIWARCLQALCHHARGDGEAALTSLGRALAQAAPEGYVRVFADEGPPMATLLRLARARGIEPAYCAALLGAFPGAVPAAPDGSPDQSALVEPLTARELEVLRLIAAGASNQGVADALILSVGTVKKHVNNILGKLGVHSRTQALARARDLGLL